MQANERETAASEQPAKVKCGLIMPIAAMGEYTEAHWSDVRSIVSESLADVGFEANLVSYADEVSLIHKTIVQNLYDNPIVICDVSGKNPNVMFELGIRLAFDKPTVVIKDDATSYSFDTSPIEHIPYPRDLRFPKVIDFKSRLESKVLATIESGKDPAYSTFLKHFGKFTVAKLDEHVVTEMQYILQELQALRREVNSSQSRASSVPPPAPGIRRIYGDLYVPLAHNEVLYSAKGINQVAFGDFVDFTENHSDVVMAKSVQDPYGNSGIAVRFRAGMRTDEMENHAVNQFYRVAREQSEAD